MVEFGEKVKQVREEKGMTQQTVAEKLYVTRQAVSRWECGARHPDLLTAKKLACGYMFRFRNFTDLGFAVTTVHMAGKISMSALLGYQAYVWNKKKKKAYAEN